MKRFDGSYLGIEPHISVIGSTKVGNIIATLPLLNGLRKKYKNAVIDFWGSEITKDIEKALICEQGESKSIINWRTSWDKYEENKFFNLAKTSIERGSPDLAINCDGFNPTTQVLCNLLQPTWVAGACITNDGRGLIPWGKEINQKFLADDDWDSKYFLERYKDHFKSQYIGELMCKMAYVDYEEAFISKIIEPRFKVPDVLIHCTSTRSAKSWTLRGWQQVISWVMKEGKTIGIVGASKKEQKDTYKSNDIEEELIKTFSNLGEKNNHNIVDLRGKTSLLELAGAFRTAKAVISVDAGPAHIAASVGTEVLFVVGNDCDGVGASPIRLWIEGRKNVSRTVSSYSCTLCSDNRFKNNECIAEEHFCMKSVDSSDIIEWLKERL